MARVSFLVCALLAVSLPHVRGFVPGSIVVTRVGDGTATLNAAATAGFLEEYSTTGGGLLSTTALPTASSSACTLAGSSTTEGDVAQSTDGAYLTLGCYRAIPGTGSVAGTSASSISRVIARVDAVGTVDTTTTLTPAAGFSSGNIRSAVSDGSTGNIWAVGSIVGVVHTTFGSQASIKICSPPTNIRTVRVFNGQLLVSTASSPYNGVSAVGTGTPTPPEQPTAVLLPGFPGATATNSQGFAQPFPETIYLANGMIEKWVLQGSTWTLVGSSPTGSYTYLTARIVGGAVELYAVVGTGTRNTLVKLVDSAASTAVPSFAPAVTVATAPTNTAFRGVAFAPTADGAAPTPAPSPAPTPAPVGDGSPTPEPTAAPTAELTPAPTPAPTAACSATITRTYTIQGSGVASPLVGTTVTTAGIVFATYPGLSGFAIQDASGDGDTATSDGLFIFCGSATVCGGVAYPIVTQLVYVTGTVVEFGGVTELSPVSKVEACGSGELPAPTPLQAPWTVAKLESLEGMRITNADPLIISGNNNLEQFGEMIMAANERLISPTNLQNYPATAAGRAAYAAAQAANDARTIILDDGRSTNYFTNPTAPRLYDFNDASHLRSGNGAIAPGGVDGLLHFGPVNEFRIHPIEKPTFIPGGNPRPTTPPAVGGNLVISSFNAENFFTTLGCGNNCRGADNPADFQKQRTKSVNAILSTGASLLALEEIENNGNTAISNLVGALNAADAIKDWEYIRSPVNCANPSNGTPICPGEDVIKCAIIYRTGQVTPVGPAKEDTNPIHNRAPLAQTFLAGSETFTLVGTHFKSKGSCPSSGPDTDQGVGAGCFNDLRTKQAQRLVEWLATDPTSSGDTDFFVTGDINSYNEEDPIQVLQNNAFLNFVNLAEKYYAPTERYSYVFDGQAGQLDHLLASVSAERLVENMRYHHIDADESTAFGYEGPAYDGTDPYRSSDHDPAVIGITVDPTVVPTPAPTAAPTAEPTAAPTAEPTAAPTAEPTAAPTPSPTATPTAAPTAPTTCRGTGATSAYTVVFGPTNRAGAVCSPALGELARVNSNTFTAAAAGALLRQCLGSGSAWIYTAPGKTTSVNNCLFVTSAGTVGGSTTNTQDPACAQQFARICGPSPAVAPTPAPTSTALPTPAPIVVPTPAPTAAPTAAPSATGSICTGNTATTSKLFIVSPQSRYGPPTAENVCLANGGKLHTISGNGQLAVTNVMSQCSAATAWVNGAPSKPTGAKGACLYYKPSAGCQANGAGCGTSVIAYQPSPDCNVARPILCSK